MAAPESHATEPHVIATRGLRLTAGTRVLLKQLDWGVNAGQFWCLLGPNGVGKTTLLRALAGVPPLHSVELRGQPIGTWESRALARVRGLMPQQIHDAFSASVLETTLLGRHPHLDAWAWEDAADLAIARASLARVHMDDLAQRDVTTLSGGERQRVGLAQLLTQDPALMLLDEPSSHQDLHQQIAVFELLRELARAGKTLVAAVHDINLAARYATHALLLDGAGGAIAGPVGTILTAEHLTRIFGHPVRKIEDAAGSAFIPV
jgi:ABC-type cobalamin/Fe3+-siderophores transport system ATPase subunit